MNVTRRPLVIFAFDPRALARWSNRSIHSGSLASSVCESCLNETTEWQLIRMRA